MDMRVLCVLCLFTDNFSSGPDGAFSPVRV